VVGGRTQLHKEEAASALYLHQDDEAVRHAMSVACGLDSLVLGEPQILGQLKEAVARAQELGAIKALLNRWFQHTFSVAKRVRSETEIGANAVSVAMRRWP